MANFSDAQLDELENDVSNIIEKITDNIKLEFFDVQIDCDSIFLPAHKYVLCSRSEILAEQLSSGVLKLNWKDYGANTSIALLRWIYTDKIVLDNYALALGLLSASHHLQLASLFETCEGSLISSVNDETSLEIYKVAKKVGANKLIDRCKELGSIRLDRPQEPTVPMDIDNEVNIKSNVCSCVCTCGEQALYIIETKKRLTRLYEELKKVKKVSNGYFDFRSFGDTEISTSDGIFLGHGYFLSTRCKMLRDEIEKNNKLDFRSLFCKSQAFLQWLYTDKIELDNADVALKFLNVSHKYQLATMFERCEEALLKSINITSCAEVHRDAKVTGATALLDSCNQMIARYWNNLPKQELDLPKMDVDSLCETAKVQKTPVVTGTGGELLILNDDCLLHIFRFVSLVDLGSIKDTCTRLRPLADKSFKIRKEKSLSINFGSIFADIWNLKHFGKFVQSLYLNNVYRQYASYEQIFETIANVSTEELKWISLSLNDDESLTDESFKRLEKIVKNVETIQLADFHDQSHYELLLSYCENLKEVDIDGDEMVLNGLWCSRNVNITSLTLTGLQNDDILREVSKNLIHLESLVYECAQHTSNNIGYLSQMNNLRRLKIRPNNNNIGYVLQNFINKNALEYLYLSSLDMNETLADSLVNFPNLNELVFESCNSFDAKKLNILSKKLVNIKKLAFVDCEEITFEDITKIIENLFDLRCLSIYGCEEIDSIKRSSYLRLTKRRNLEIFLDSEDYKRTIKFIGNNLSNYVRVTAKLSEYDFYRFHIEL